MVRFVIEYALVLAHVHHAEAIEQRRRAKLNQRYHHPATGTTHANDPPTRLRASLLCCLRGGAKPRSGEEHADKDAENGKFVVPAGQEVARSHEVAEDMERLPEAAGYGTDADRREHELADKVNRGFAPTRTAHKTLVIAAKNVTHT
jgi:hypothetical protein